MITYVVGDLFESPAKVLVNTVNTVGAMGKGIALNYKRVYPEMFKQYQYFCEQNLFDIGQLWLYKTSHKWILNFPTKKDWRNKSTVEYIEAGLDKFVNTYDSKGIVSISFPMLGCGNGELDWKSQVQPLMEEYLRPLPIDIFIHHLPQDASVVPEHRNIHETKKWLRNEPHFLTFAEFWDDLTRLIDTEQDFETLNNEIRFRVFSDLFGQNLRFERNSHVFEIHKAAFEELWAQIRSSGYFLVDDLSFDEPRYNEFVAGLLQNLTYIRPIRLSFQADTTEWEVGLLLSAPSSERVSEPQLVLSA